MKEREFILSEDQYVQSFKEESEDCLKSDEVIASDLEPIWLDYNEWKFHERKEITPDAFDPNRVGIEYILPDYTKISESYIVPKGMTSIVQKWLQEAVKQKSLEIVIKNNIRMQERDFPPRESIDILHYKEEDTRDHLKTDADITHDLEQNILRMARQGATYKQIRLSLGNPSRQVIRNVIRNRDPELFKVLGNTKAVDKLRDKRFAEDGEIEDEDTA